jgi:hypothetical protein
LARICEQWKTFPLQTAVHVRLSHPICSFLILICSGLHPTAPDEIAAGSAPHAVKANKETPTTNNVVLFMVLVPRGMAQTAPSSQARAEPRGLVKSRNISPAERGLPRRLR